MKKLLLIIAITLIAVSFSGCMGNQSEVTTSTSPQTTETTAQKAEEDVEILISKASISDVDVFKSNLEEYAPEFEDLSEENKLKVTFNADSHKKLCEDKSRAVIEVFEGYENDESSYVEKIEYDEDFRNLKIIVDKAKWESTDASMNDILIASNALSYQTYLEEGQKSFVQVIASDSEEVLNKFNLPLNINVE